MPTATAANEVYVECRQITAPTGLDVFAAPCPSPGQSPVVHLPACARIHYVVSNKFPNMCGDQATWIQATYTDLDGVLQYGWMTAGSAAGSTIAECPSKYCKSVQPPEWSCRQVTATSGITMFKQPCYDQTLRVSSSDLQRWDTFRYSGAYSKQTSRCGQGIRQDLCFVKARGCFGWQAARGLGANLPNQWQVHRCSVQLLSRLFQRGLRS